MGVQQDAVDLIGKSESNPWSIRTERWNKAEKAAERIISIFQPTIAAQRKRDAVINYLQRLLKDNLDCEVFVYGSVPLKTYLPDGDIDVSVMGARPRGLIKEIASLLENEGKNTSAEFVVKDVQVIGAQVKLVKCMVQNLVVDISFNQIGGLCTLCFLEQVDRVIQKDHVFKRSIILIKAWCYYESRTLGAHVGLISTYGLETLVLYIFHVFHLSIDGPLSVLYKFLEYFSAFDWDNYGISLVGPVRISELPRIIVERPPNSDDLLLQAGFIRRCSATLSTAMRPGDVFSKKHLNIVDPLNGHNNLGRSVSQGNFFRIRSALSYGDRKLGQILMAPEDEIPEGLLSFFPNTLKTHQQASQLTVSLSGAEKSFTARINEKPRSSNDENEYLGNGSPGNRISSEENDNSTLTFPDPVSVPFYAPRLFSQYKLVNKTEDNDHDDGDDDVKQSEESEPLDLTGDLMSHLVCLNHVRWWNNYVFAPPAMMGPPPPPPPPVLLSMIALEQGGFHRPQLHPSDQMFMSRPPFILNDPNLVNHFLDMNGCGHHGYHTSISLNPNAPEGVSRPPVPVQVQVQQREPLLHRRRYQNSNRGARQLDQRPRSISGMDRFNAESSSYHLKDDADFPPLSG